MQTSTLPIPMAQNNIDRNIERTLAKDYMLNTARHLFLTGRAGSGKTTLLQEVLLEADKSMVVVAPTGVAAINAGGVTIHSFFQIPPATFLPTNDFLFNDRFVNRPMLKEHMKMGGEKQRLIRELDTLVIDEISMVRADLLDAIDFVLRFVRRSTQPFGGIQVVMVGDLYQLPPVVKEVDWSTLSEYYQTPYFFNAMVWKQAKMVPIELKKVYRQKDSVFLDMLNNIRDGKLSGEDLELLNTRYFPDGKQEAILLTTHNRSANTVNDRELDSIDAPKLTFKAAIKGKFKEGNYPCAETLVLKKGAKVMFVRNDAERRYFNGKLAEVAEYDADENKIKVKFQADGSTCWIERVTWENIRFKSGEEEGSINKETIGEFTQFPLRLAWAVTVHKSQGLTLEQVCLDLIGSFASGQAYVALSRCTSLEGLYMKSKIGQQQIIVDYRIRDFYKKFPANDVVESRLEPAKKAYALYRLRRTFQLFKILAEYERWLQYIDRSSFGDQNEYTTIAEKGQLAALNLQSTSNDFTRHLETWINESSTNPNRIPHIINRSDKAIAYFANMLFNEIINPLHQHIGDIQNKSRIKKYLQLAMSTYDTAWQKIEALYHLRYNGQQVYTGQTRHQQSDLPEWTVARMQTKKKKGATFEITLGFFRQGMTIPEIAERRELTVGTIESHLTRWLKTGDIQLTELIKAERIEQLLAKIEQFEPLVESTTELKDRIGKDVSYAELRWLQWYRQEQSEENS